MYACSPTSIKSYRIKIVAVNRLLISPCSQAVFFSPASVVPSTFECLMVRHQMSR